MVDHLFDISVIYSINFFKLLQEEYVENPTYHILSISHKLISSNAVARVKWIYELILAKLSTSGC